MLKPPADVPPGLLTADPAGSSARTSDSRPTRVRRSILGPLLLFTLFGAWYTLPGQGGDRESHLCAIVEARNALREGQFPPRVAPTLSGGIRCPVFQFYGAFPYTFAAAFMLTPVGHFNAYDAWKMVMLVCVSAAGFYTYLCALRLTRQVWPSVVAGVLFVTAPYLSTDFRARFAYPEAVSMCLLPVVLYYSLRSFARRGRIGPVVSAGVAWSLLALSHNITFLYGSALIALLFLTLPGRDLEKYVRRMTRVGMGYGLGAVLSLWFIIPQLRVLKYIVIANANMVLSPLWSARWGPLPILLAPVLKMTEEMEACPYMGIQVGWAILGAVALAAVTTAWATLQRLRRRPEGLRPPGARIAAALLLAWAIAFFVAWSPVDFWPYVPRLFYNIQILYRMLMFVTLWGSLAGGVGLALWWRRRPGGMPAGAAWTCVLVAAVASITHQGWALDSLSRQDVRSIIAVPTFTAETVYRPELEKISAFRLVVPPDTRLMDAEESRPFVRHGRVTEVRLRFDAPRVVQLPILFYPEGLIDLRVDGRVQVPRHIDGLLALDLPAGPHRITVEFAGIRWTNWLSGIAALGVLVFALAVAGQRLKSAIRARRALSTGPRGRSNTDFPLRAALFAFVMLAVPLSVAAPYYQWRRHVALAAVRNVRASSYAHEHAKPIFALDGLTATAWSALDPKPGWLSFELTEPKQVSLLELEPRPDLVLCGWHKVGVVLYLQGREVVRQQFELPDAYRQPLQVLKLDRPAVADKVELLFSDPVTLSRTGDAHVDPAVTYPGYREIRIR